MVFIVSVHCCFGQEIRIDTSYTVHSAYRKSIKEFPEISIIRATEYSNVINHDDIIYSVVNDRPIHLDLYRSLDMMDNPTIILLHGGGWKSGNKSHMRPLASALASKGYTCINLEYRLSPEAIFPAGIEDVFVAIDFIIENAEKYGVDKNKIAILGCSSGGQMASLVGTTYHTKNTIDTGDYTYQKYAVKAIVNIDGILAFRHPESKEGKSASKWLGGTYDEIPEVWDFASALSHADRSTPPILFINSQHPRFHAGRDDVIKILDKHDIYSEIKEISKSPHTFWLFYPWFEETITYIDIFLEKVFN